jgi:hypothetical protein
VSDPVTYTAVLPIGESTVARLVALLEAERAQRRTRPGRRAVDTKQQAVLVLRWFCDATRVVQLATDNRISLASAYRYLHEGIDVLAAAAPGLYGALLAARAAGHTHVQLDGTLVRTDRSKAAGPTVREGKTVDLWWSGKHHHHGGNVQVITAPDGWPLWVSEVRPGREHDITCARGHAGLFDALDAWTDTEHAVLADLGYEGEATRLTCPIKKPTPPKTPASALRPANTPVLSVEQRTINTLHSATRALAERGNSLLKTTFKALRRVSLCPWRIGAITAAALVLLHTEHDRTT